MLPAILAAIRQTPESNYIITTFTDGIQCALSRRFFNFSNCTAAFFFEPGTPDFDELFKIVSYDFEQRVLLDLINITDIVPNDLRTRTPPAWGGPDVLTFADQFMRSAAVHHSAFVNSVTARITHTTQTQNLLARSHRVNAQSDLRSILCAFGSIYLLAHTLTTSTIITPPHDAVVSRAYLQRVIEHFAIEPVLEQRVQFNGPVNDASAVMGISSDEPFYTPVRPVSNGSYNALTRLVIAAHRTLCCMPASQIDVLATSNFVISFLYLPPAHIWTVSSSTPQPPPPAPTPAPAPVYTSAARTPARIVRTPHHNIDIVVPPTPRAGAPQTPSGVRTVPPLGAADKNTLRITSPQDNF